MVSKCPFIKIQKSPNVDVKVKVMFDLMVGMNNNIASLCQKTHLPKGRIVLLQYVDGHFFY